MKRIIINAAVISCFLLAALSSNAQQSKAPDAKIATESEQKQAMQGPANDLKEAAKPTALPIQKSEAPKQAAAPEKPKEEQQGIEELKGIEINAPTKKGMPVQNADRPKISTIKPDNKPRPMANEGLKAPDRQQ